MATRRPPTVAPRSRRGLPHEIGAPLGVLAGYFGGWVDDLVNACVQVVTNIPTLFLFIVLSVFLQPSVWQLALVFGFFFWPGTARQVRASVMSLRSREFIEAVRVLVLDVDW